MRQILMLLMLCSSIAFSQLPVRSGKTMQRNTFWLLDSTTTPYAILEGMYQNDTPKVFLWRTIASDGYDWSLRTRDKGGFSTAISSGIQAVSKGNDSTYAEVKVDGSGQIIGRVRRIPGATALSNAFAIDYDSLLFSVAGSEVFRLLSTGATITGNSIITGTLNIDSIITALRLTSNLTVDGTVTGDTLVGDWTITGNWQSTAQGSLAGVASAKFYYQPSTGNTVLGSWGKDASTIGTISFYLAKSDGSGGEIEVSIDSVSTNFTGNALPSAASTYALGSATSPWSYLYVDSASSPLGAFRMRDSLDVQYQISANSYTGGMLTTFDTARVAYLDKTNTFTQSMTLNQNLTVGGIALLDTIRNPLTQVVVDDSLTVTGNVYLPTTTAAVGGVYINAAQFLHGFGTNNVFVGDNAGNFTLSGANLNVGVGTATLKNLTTGDFNIAVGYLAGTNMTTGSSNVSVGYRSANGVTTGSRNILIGFSAGELAGNVSDKLYIEPTISTTPLIGGDFAADSVDINGTLNVTENVNVANILAVNGADMTSDDATFALLNVTPTTINAFGAATTISMGALTGTTTINNDLVVGDELVVQGTGTSSFAGDVAINGGDITTTGDLTITPAGKQVKLNGGSGAMNLFFQGTGSADLEQILFQKNDSTKAAILYRPYGASVPKTLRILTNKSDHQMQFLTGNQVIALTLDSSQGATFAAGISGTTGTFSGDVAINGDDLTSDGDLTITPAGDDVTISSDGTTRLFVNSAAGVDASLNFLENSVAKWAIYHDASADRFAIFNSGLGANAMYIDSATSNATFAAGISGTTILTGKLTTVDTIRAGDYATYSYFIPGGSLVTSSDSTSKWAIRSASFNLANFGKVTPREYRFKKENFLRTFDESSVPDSIDVQINDSTSVRRSNRKAKDAARTEFYFRNNQWAERMSQVEHNGFLAQEFNQQLFGRDSKEIRQEDINIALWLKVQELEARIKKLEELR